MKFRAFITTLLLTASTLLGSAQADSTTPAPAPAPAPTSPTPAPAPPATCVGGVCVASPDLAVFLEAVKEKQCLMKTNPVVTGDAIQIVIDKSGRVYGSGSDPHPFTMHLTWCNYQLDAVGQTKVIAAQAQPDTVGFRFRPKAAIGLLGTELATGSTFQNSVDAGALVEPFFFLTDFNVNAYVGVRSVGAGLGWDLTKNVGVYLGYALTWGQWRSNPMAALYFAIW